MVAVTCTLPNLNSLPIDQKLCKPAVNTERESNFQPAEAVKTDVKMQAGASFTISLDMFSQKFIEERRETLT